MVPTIYSRALAGARKIISTNQYAVTEQSYLIDERTIPGIFYKFDIEPILLRVSEERGGFLGLLVKIVNVVSGVLVGGGWCYQLADWVSEVRDRRKRKSQGVLGAEPGHEAEE